MVGESFIHQQQAMESSKEDSISPGKLPALLSSLCQKINETIYWEVEN